MTVKILKIEQSNPHFDEKKKNNGGGYDQPVVTFEYKGVIGTYRNSSCGDFGSRYHLEWNGKLILGALCSMNQKYLRKSMLMTATKFSKQFTIKMIARSSMSSLKFNDC
ncbi:hypothetical protein SGH21_002425 [Staphylococcus pseudintermedius]|nr:hypothetical protein [Staphylococcus pseudintermedius]